MQIIGNYSLNIEIGGIPTTIPPQMIRELTITQDVERLLPTFKMTLQDATKILSDVVSYDKNANTIRIEFARGTNESELNTFDFQVKYRGSVSPADFYSVEGVLDIPGVLTDYRNRALTGNIRTNLQTVIAQEGMGITTTQIGISLNYEKTLLQPNWTDSKLLRYLRRNLIGRNQEGGYYSFVKVERGEKIFVMKSLNELLLSSIKYRFIVGHREYQDFYPVSEYRIVDNSQFLTDLGGQAQDYSYFDWDTGSYVSNSVSIDDCPALSEFFLVDADNKSDSVLYTDTGRSNSFTEDFDGRIRNDFYRRVNSSIIMWISTWGIENISPGDIVYVIFSEALERGDVSLYQHTGLWMVKRVVHIIGSSFMTNLQLVRCGIDTDIQTTLLKTTNRNVQ